MWRLRGRRGGDRIGGGGWEGEKGGKIGKLRERRGGERREKKKKWWKSRGKQEGGREEY
jgi:hypothetical protein